MRIGVPTEVKEGERRVAMTPSGVRELARDGHAVFVQSGAGDGSSLSDEDYAAEGASVLPDAASVFGESDLILKVKEPQPSEVRMLEARHTLFAYLHLAPDRELTSALIDSGSTCIALETVTDRSGRLPLLAPMSEVAGRIAGQAGAFILGQPAGRGVLLGGVTGVPAGRVLVIGGGVAGMNAATVMLALGAQVTVFDRSLDRLREIEAQFGARLSTCFATAMAIEERLEQADLVIGAVLVRGAKAPHVLKRKHLQRMPRHAVLVDVSIDQGGCFETSRPTTHSDPTYEVDEIVHYCVANMPASVPITSTHALTSATAPYVSALAEQGVMSALRSDPGFAAGLSVSDGILTNEAVGLGQDRDWTTPDRFLHRS